MGCSSYLSKALLDWSLQGATPTRPTGLFLGWATATPNGSTDFAGPVVRRTLSMGAALSPSTDVGAATATNLAAFTGTATAACTLVGWNLYESVTGGQRLFYGTLTAGISCASGDFPAIPLGALRIGFS